MKNDGGPAFPYVLRDASDQECSGMSLRDWFAGLALMAAGVHAHDARADRQVLAQQCYTLAAAMLKERENP